MLLIGALMIVLLQIALIQQASVPRLPLCPEDTAIVGQGQYEQGYWTRYACIPVDDIAGY
ncbi:MAG: hypothetical protein ACW99U_16640 [Candidatus Thorarchaeota archaeon]|jgi:hypothetical protein